MAALLNVMTHMKNLERRVAAEGINNVDEAIFFDGLTPNFQASQRRVGLKHLAQGEAAVLAKAVIALDGDFLQFARLQVLCQLNHLIIRQDRTAQFQHPEWLVLEQGSQGLGLNEILSSFRNANGHIAQLGCCHQRVEDRIKDAVTGQAQMRKEDRLELGVSLERDQAIRNISRREVGVVNGQLADSLGAGQEAVKAIEVEGLFRKIFEMSFFQVGEISKGVPEKVLFFLGQVINKATVDLNSLHSGILFNGFDQTFEVQFGVASIELEKRELFVVLLELLNNTGKSDFAATNRHEHTTYQSPDGLELLLVVASSCGRRSCGG